MNADPFDPTAELAARDRYRRELYRRMTPAERMAHFYALQAYHFSVLQRHPAGWQRYVERNCKKRAIRWPDDLPR